MALATQTRAAQAAQAGGAGLKDTRKSLCRQPAVAPRAALASPPFCLGPVGSPGHHGAALDRPVQRQTQLQHFRFFPSWLLPPSLTE